MFFPSSFSSFTAAHHKPLPSPPPRSRSLFLSQLPANTQHRLLLPRGRLSPDHPSYILANTQTAPQPPPLPQPAALPSSAVANLSYNPISTSTAANPSHHAAAPTSTSPPQPAPPPSTSNQHPNTQAVTPAISTASSLSRHAATNLNSPMTAKHPHHHPAADSHTPTAATAASSLVMRCSLVIRRRSSPLARDTSSFIAVRTSPLFSAAAAPARRRHRRSAVTVARNSEILRCRKLQ